MPDARWNDARDYGDLDRGASELAPMTIGIVIIAKQFIEQPRMGLSAFVGKLPRNRMVMSCGRAFACSRGY